jgi:hypothetical protein
VHAVLVGESVEDLVDEHGSASPDGVDANRGPRPVRAAVRRRVFEVGHEASQLLGDLVEGLARDHDGILPLTCDSGDAVTPLWYQSNMRSAIPVVTIVTVRSAGLGARLRLVPGGAEGGGGMPTPRDRTGVQCAPRGKIFDPGGAVAATRGGRVGEHVDVVLNDPVKGVQRCVAVVVEEHGELFVKDADGSIEAIIRRVIDSPKVVGAANPLRALANAMKGMHLCALDPHDAAVCPFLAGAELPMTDGSFDDAVAAALSA